jgi:hypothetical protein
MKKLDNITVVGNRFGACSHVFIDGEQVGNVQSVRVDVTAQDLSVVTLRILAKNVKIEYNESIHNPLPVLSALAEDLAKE